MENWGNGLKSKCSLATSEMLLPPQPPEQGQLLFQVRVLASCRSRLKCSLCQVPLPTLCLCETGGSNFFTQAQKGTCLLALFIGGLGSIFTGAPSLVLMIRTPMKPRKGNGPATGPQGLIFPLHLGALFSPASISQPEAPPLPGCESPFSFSLWNNRKKTALSRKQSCKWGLRLENEAIIQALQG